MVCNSLPVSNNSLQKPSKIQQLPKLDCENAVRVEFEEKSGRFCRAAKPIKRGSVIGVQKPHVSILDEEETSEKCWHCFSKLESPVPCSGCSSVLFCGSQCRKAADEKYHRWECGLLDIFHLSKLGGTVKSRFNEWPPSAHFYSLNRNFTLNLDFLIRNFILVKRSCTLNRDSKLNRDSFKLTQ